MEEVYEITETVEQLRAEPRQRLHFIGSNPLPRRLSPRPGRTDRVVEQLRAKLRELENALQQLLRTKMSLEHDLNTYKCIYYLSVTVLAARLNRVVISPAVVLETYVLVSRRKFCGLGLGLEALVSALLEIDQ